MRWCGKRLTSEENMKDKKGWQVVGVCLVQKVFTLNILKIVQITEGSNDPNSCLFRFISGQLFDAAPSIVNTPDLEGASCVWQGTLSLLRESVGFDTLESVSKSWVYMWKKKVRL
jgi:hypothetical protein